MTRRALIIWPHLEDPSLMRFEQAAGAAGTPVKAAGTAMAAAGRAAPGAPAGSNGGHAAAAVNGSPGMAAAAAAAGAAAGAGAGAKAPKRIAPQAMSGVGATPAGGMAGEGIGAAPRVAPPAPAAGPAAVAGPPSVAPTATLQQETRGNDGRRRIMPVPQGGGDGGGAGEATGPGGGFNGMMMPQRMAPTPMHGHGGGQATGFSPPGGSSALKRRIEPTAVGAPVQQDPKRMMNYGAFSGGGGGGGGGDSRGGGGNSRGAYGGGGGGGTTVMMLAPGTAGAAAVPTRAPPATLHCQLDGGEADPFAAAAAAAAFGEGGGAASAPPAGPTMLEVRNGERHSDVVCSTAGAVRWTDRCGESRATHICGTSKFAAVFFENGCVQLYTPAGRRAMPPLVMPGRAAFVNAKAGQLIAVTGDCSLIVWELGTAGREEQIMRESVAPLLTGPRAPPAPPLTGVRLAAGGQPVAQFADGHAYVFHPRLKAWARVADHSFPRSEFTTRLRLPAAAGGMGGGGTGELHALQVAAARAAVGMGPSALLSGGAPAPRRETGRHLECLMVRPAVIPCRTHLITKRMKLWMTSIDHVTIKLSMPPIDMPGLILPPH
jgi:protein HIRA/HIR1